MIPEGQNCRIRGGGKFHEDISNALVVEHLRQFATENIAELAVCGVPSSNALRQLRVHSPNGPKLRLEL